MTKTKRQPRPTSKPEDNETSVDDLRAGDFISVRQPMQPIGTGYFKEADETKVYLQQEAGGKTYYVPRHPAFTFHILKAAQSNVVNFEVWKQAKGGVR